MNRQRYGTQRHSRPGISPSTSHPHKPWSAGVDSWKGQSSSTAWYKPFISPSRAGATSSKRKAHSSGNRLGRQTRLSWSTPNTLKVACSINDMRRHQEKSAASSKVGVRVRRNIPSFGFHARGGTIDTISLASVCGISKDSFSSHNQERKA